MSNFVLENFLWTKTPDEFLTKIFEFSGKKVQNLSLHRLYILLEWRHGMSFSSKFSQRRLLRRIFFFCIHQAAAHRHSNHNFDSWVSLCANLGSFTFSVHHRIFGGLNGCPIWRRKFECLIRNDDGYDWISQKFDEKKNEVSLIKVHNIRCVLKSFGSYHGVLYHYRATSSPVCISMKIFFFQSMCVHVCESHSLMRSLQ